MGKLLEFAAWFSFGYLATTKVLPMVVAKLEAIDLDDAWEVWNDSSDDIA